MSGGEPGRDSDVLAESLRNEGAVVIGRRMFDLAEQPWGDEPPFRLPVFVLTHRPRPALAKRGGTTFTFVTDGIETALAQAQAAANGKDVSVGGGASVIQQALQAGLVDEIHIHLVALLLGAGVRLFDNLGAQPVKLELLRTAEGSGVTHLAYRVAR
jgi:dihydrofolate reductase